MVVIVEINTGYWHLIIHHKVVTYTAGVVLLLEILEIVSLLYTAARLQIRSLSHVFKNFNTGIRIYTD